MMSSSSGREPADRLVGAILGQALGDALGFVVEAEAPGVALDYVTQCLRAGRAGERCHRDFLFGQYSDDTQLARELLGSFVDCGRWNPEAFARRVAELFRDRRDVGAGEGTRSAAQRLLDGVHWRESGTPAPYAGNGSAMRAGPLGVLIPDRGAVCQAAEEQSRITHLDPRCAAGAVALARAVALASVQPLDRDAFLAELIQCAAATEPSVGEAIAGMSAWLHRNPAAAAEHLHRAGLDPVSRGTWRGISASVIPSVLWSLYAFLRSPDDYWETVCTAIAVGGDTDTMAAMAGAMSGARLGPEALPPRLLERVNDRGEWDAPALTQLARAAATSVTRSRDD
jgi:poly(ADP-ribose) glycohydrolase ARH3